MNPRITMLIAALATATAPGCKKKVETEPAAQPTSGYSTYPSTYGTTTQPQQTYPTTPAATATTAPAATATATTMSTPSDMATPCQDDTPCLTHHCNVAYGKCAFPCQTNADCLPGNQCMSPVCVPMGATGAQ